MSRVSKTCCRSKRPSVLSHENGSKVRRLSKNDQMGPPNCENGCSRLGTPSPSTSSHQIDAEIHKCGSSDSLIYVGSFRPSWEENPVIDLTGDSPPVSRSASSVSLSDCSRTQGYINDFMSFSSQRSLIRLSNSNVVLPVVKNNVKNVRKVSKSAASISLIQENVCQFSKFKVLGLNPNLAGFLTLEELRRIKTCTKLNKSDEKFLDMLCDYFESAATNKTTSVDIEMLKRIYNVCENDDFD